MAAAYDPSPKCNSKLVQTIVSCSSIASLSNPLNMSLIPASFEQQGAVNWDNLAHRALSVSIDILSRCSAAGVDPYTLLAGQVIAQGLPLSLQGQRNVQSALQNLPMRQGVDRLLWFGFGIKSIVRQLSTTNEGCSLLALCSTLSECFHEDYAAEVMHNLVLSYNPPGNLTPSLDQWLMLIRACAGVFSTTKYPILAETFYSLLAPGNSAFNIMPNVKDLAAVIRAIGQIASQQVESIHVTSRPASAWVAAFAEWLFDLRLTVHGEQGATLYRNHDECQAPQVTIQIETEPLDSQSRVPAQDIQIASKSYIINDYKDFIVSYGEESFAFATGGRVPWKSCLGDSFGEDFDLLISNPMAVGQIIGIAAAALDEKLFDGTKKLRPHSYGVGLCESMVQYFPELLPAREAMKQASSCSWKTLDHKWAEAVRAVLQMCQCDYCAYVKENEDYDGMHCLFDMLATVVRIGLALTSVDGFEMLAPTPHGIVLVHKQQTSQGSLAWIRTSDGNKDFRINPCSFAEYALSLGMRPEPGYIIGVLLSLFTGRDAHELQRYQGSISAASASGLCVYRQLLHGFRSEIESFERYCILPGGIEYNSRRFRIVGDRLLQDSRCMLRSRQRDLTSFRTEQVEITLTETVKELYVGYTIRNASTETDTAGISFDPELAREAMSYWKVAEAHCPRKSETCQNTLLGEADLDYTDPPFIRVRLQGWYFILYMINPTQNFLLAMAMAREVYFSRYVGIGPPPPPHRLVENLCINCFLRITHLHLGGGSWSTHDSPPLLLIVRDENVEEWLEKPYRFARAERNDVQRGLSS